MIPMNLSGDKFWLWIGKFMINIHPEQESGKNWCYWLMVFCLLAVEQNIKRKSCAKLKGFFSLDPSQIVECLQGCWENEFLKPLCSAKILTAQTWPDSHIFVSHNVICLHNVQTLLHGFALHLNQTTISCSTYFDLKRGLCGLWDQSLFNQK